MYTEFPQSISYSCVFQYHKTQENRSFGFYHKQNKFFSSIKLQLTLMLLKFWN